MQKLDRGGETDYILSSSHDYDGGAALLGNMSRVEPSRDMKRSTKRNTASHEPSLHTYMWPLCHMVVPHHKNLGNMKFVQLNKFKSKLFGDFIA